MHNTVIGLLALGALFVLTLTPVSFADEVIFSDDFSDGDYEGWEQTVGDWGVAGTFFCAEACTSCGGIGEARTVDVFSWDEGFTITGRIKLDETIDNYGRSMCWFSEGYDDAVCVEYRASISEICVDVLVNWGLAIHECVAVEEAEWNGLDGAWHEFTIRVSNNNLLEVFKDGKDIVVVQDDSLAGFSRTGFVRLGVQSCLSCFDDIVVTSLGTEFVCGDCDGSGSVDIDDIVFTIAYVFTGGPAPDPIEAADANCSGGADIDDVVYLIAYVFNGGPPPCDTDNDGQPDC